MVSGRSRTTPALRRAGNGRAASAGRSTSAGTSTSKVAAAPASRSSGESVWTSADIGVSAEVRECVSALVR